MESDIAPSHGPHYDAALLALETTVAPALFAHKMAGEALRVWVPGCATGEAAYAVAIVFCAHAEWVDNPPAIQIFATDSDTDAIATARRGRYPTSLAATISPERLRRFFHKDEQHYQIIKKARDLVIFAQHQVLRDPPFAHLDLIVCRNLLTTFSLDAQEQLLNVFHLGPPAARILRSGRGGGACKPLTAVCKS
jgi:two-component system CheB/CheR fusion protein